MKSIFKNGKECKWFIEKLKTKLTMKKCKYRINVSVAVKF